MSPEDYLMTLIRTAGPAALRVALGGLVGRVDVLVAGRQVYDQRGTAEQIRDGLIRSLEESATTGGAR